MRGFLYICDIGATETRIRQTGGDRQHDMTGRKETDRNLINQRQWQKQQNRFYVCFTIVRLKPMRLALSRLSLSIP